MFNSNNIIMKFFPFYLKAILIVFSTGLMAQNRPPAEVDKTIRATSDILKNPSAKDYKAFINSYYSQEYIMNTDIDALVNHIKSIKKSTVGAREIGVENNNGVLQIIFSGGVNASVEMYLDQKTLGKIRSLNLAQEKDVSEMYEEEHSENALMGRMKKLESLSKITSDQEFEEFIKENFSASFLAKNDRDELLQSLKKLRIAVAGASMFGAKPSANGGAILELRGGKSADVLFSVEENSPYRINEFKVDTDVTFLGEGGATLLPVTWDDYVDQLKQEESKGFSGMVLMVKNGKIEHQKGYGLANRAGGVNNNDKTIYDIGSIPIDFTRAAILKLVDQGKVTYADPISKFINEVPADKKPITIEHLMNNTSGLHNFHGEESKDKDLDLSWISREQAITRMLGRSLLFEPGTDVSPSHSGYGLLAAIVEIVSGKTYERFLNENFFNPLNMNNTGPYGKDSGLNPENMAVGYGNQTSDPNTPTNWGPTSWLIKGSGGMVSNPMDLYLWNKGLHDGEILSQKSKEIYKQGSMALGGSDRGFFAAYVRSPNNTVIICSNSDRSKYPDTMTLFQSLSNLYK